MTTKRPIAPGIAEAAADWIVRRDGGEMSAGDERAFATWHALPEHREALARLEKVWGLLDDDEEPAEAAEPVADLPRQRAACAPARSLGVRGAVRPKRRALAAGGIAAALALVVLGGVQDWPMRLRADHMTGIGERRELALSDGSAVRLDSGSAIAVDYTGSRRGVRLLAGAAMFEVAPDRSRPFTVEAGGGSVTALGTAFAIRDEEGGATVTVTRHSVRVEGGGRAAVVGEGQRADFGDRTLRGPLPARGDATAWTRGRLVVVDRPLGEVVEEIGRYRRGYVAVTGPAAAIRVSGVYDLDHPLAAIDSIQTSHALSSVRLSDRFIILRR
ncbi:MAG TPA: FecR family protein [Novosphingobium sp.]|nr:FecR family protein [Novosphingobium sp.]